MKFAACKEHTASSSCRSKKRDRLTPTEADDKHTEQSGRSRQKRRSVSGDNDAIVDFTAAVAATQQLLLFVTLLLFDTTATNVTEAGFAGVYFLEPAVSHRGNDC